MRSDPRPGRAWRCLSPSILLAAVLCACGPHIVINRPASPCSTLIPTDWLTDVAGAPLPPTAATIGDWIGFADAQTGQLEKANDRTRASISIVTACDKRDAETVKALTPKSLLARLFG